MHILEKNSGFLLVKKGVCKCLQMIHIILIIDLVMISSSVEKYLLPEIFSTVLIYNNF